MKKKLLLSVIFSLFATFVFTQVPRSALSRNYEDIVSNYQQLNYQQLLDTADHYYKNDNFETALAYYSLIINTPTKDDNLELKKTIVEALNSSAVIYYFMCDYRTSYEFLIKALLLCEIYNIDSYCSKIYNNIGNIYSRFKKYDISKTYYAKALDLCQDSVTIAILLNNLGAVELANGNIDGAFYYLDKSLQISSMNCDISTYNILANFAYAYEKRKRYDSAFDYYQLALTEIRKNNKIEKEADVLSNIAALFFEIKKPDSALFYINMSNFIAKENNFLGILAENYLTLSKIEESKGRKITALEYYKMYANLKDSVFSIDKFFEINQLQRFYEVSKTNQQIEQLVVEQQIKERTIHYQTKLQVITLSVLLLTIIALLVFFFQKKRLDFANKVLVDKNREIMELLKKPSEMQDKKYILTDNAQNELLHKISMVMEDTATICDPEFSLMKLAELVQSNDRYVSEVINKSLNKNFRSYINSYRIREAQRLFLELDVKKFKIESVAYQVGFKSQTSFRNAFKEATGVNPNFYLKSVTG
jgi:AraC-like DNA-binding protein/Tfp pilus assembly protein PilF